LHADGRDYYTLHESSVYKGLKVIRRVQVPWSAAHQRDITNEPNWDTAELEIYDLREDPNELSNLVLEAPNDPRIEMALLAFHEELEQQRLARGKFHPEGSRDIAPGIDPLDMMREFGYIGMVEQGSRPIASPQAGVEDAADSSSVSGPSQDPGQ